MIPGVHRSLSSAGRVAYLSLAIGMFVPGASGDVEARERTTFTTTDQNPLIQIYTMPWPTAPVRPASGAWAVGWNVDVANNALSRDGSGGERVILDGETWRGSLALAYGVSERFEAGVLIPLVSHQSGIFDGFIRNWHDRFGLSNARRDTFEDYSLEYAYLEGDSALLRVSAPGSGIGDVRLSGTWSLRGDGRDQRVLLLRAGVKLPTGSASRLHGSGGTDLSLQLLSTDARTLSALETTLSWMAGVLRLGPGDVLEDLRRDHVLIASLGVARPVWRNLTLKAQFDAHGPFYDSGIDILGSRTIQLVVGAGIELAQGTVDIGLTENLFTDTTPDFGIHFAWHLLL